MSDGHLVGIVTEHDFFNIAGLLLLEQLDQTPTRQRHLKSPAIVLPGLL